MKALWPFQVTAEDQARDNMRRGIRRQLLCMPTGSGKTHVAMSIVKQAADKGSRCMFVADRQFLVAQTSERFTEAGIPHGVAMSDKTFGRRERIQVASAQTLETRGFLLDGDLFDDQYVSPLPDLVIVDECHEIRRALVDKLVEHDIRTIGLSATPLTRGLGTIYETVLNVTTTDKLLTDINPDTGHPYLAPLHVIAPEVDIDTLGIRTTSSGEWEKDAVAARTVQIVGDVVGEWERQTAQWFGGPVKTLVFSASVADAELFARMYQAAGHDFQVISYHQTFDEKDAMIKAFARGDHMGLISCVALNKGFDVPDVLCLVDAYPTKKAFMRVVQRYGRVMRAADHKEFGLVIDPAKNFAGWYSPLKAFFATGVPQLDDRRLKELVGTRASDAEIQDTKDGLRCRECGFLFLEGVKVDRCPGCGKGRRPRRQPLTTSVPGTFGHVDTLDGRAGGVAGGFDGDPWPEVCAVCCGLYPGNPDKARRVALAKFKSMFGYWPAAPFQVVTRAPNPAIAEACRKDYERWRAEQNGRAA